MNEVKKNLRTTMHNHFDLRRFFGTQPFVKCIIFRASVPHLEETPRRNDSNSKP
jgi:hypothetical protein